jgi:hypothetical protein
LDLFTSSSKIPPILHTSYIPRLVPNIVHSERAGEAYQLTPRQKNNKSTPGRSQIADGHAGVRDLSKRVD